MNTFFIRLFFSIICLLIFLYVLLLSVIIGLVQGVMGAVLISGIEKTTKMILITIFSIIFSNIIFWIN